MKVWKQTNKKGDLYNGKPQSALKKGFWSTSMSCKSIRGTSSALRQSPIQVLTISPLLLNFSYETGTPHTMPQFMKVWRQKKSQKSDL